MKKKNFLFITSRGRSGSTMLRLMLDAHPNILIPPEAHFIKNLYAKYGQKKKWTKNLKAQFINDLQLDFKLKYWELDYEHLKNQFFALPENMDFRMACDTIYTSYLSPFQKNEIVYCGDKTPNNSLYLKLLLKLYPDAHFIHLVRDYRDVAEAFLRVNLESHVLSSLAYRWNMFNAPFLHYQQKFPDQFHILRYEDLVHNPEKELSILTNKLELPFYTDMLKFHETTQKIRSKLSDEESQFFKSLNHPVNSSRVGRWQHTLSKKQVITTEHICGNTGKRLGYKPKYIEHPKPYSPKFLPGLMLAYAYPTIDKVLFHFPLWVKKSYQNIYIKILKPFMFIRK